MAVSHIPMGRPAAESGLEAHTEATGWLRPQILPRSAQYNAQWPLRNQMGLNALWLTKGLCEDMVLRPGLRVLDLGCGKALSSIFHPKEHGAQVWATDLRIPAADNLRRIEEAGLSIRVLPIHADARGLPYAERFFDAIVCVDAYIYFGTDDLYVDCLRKFFKPRGRIGVVVPGFMQELVGPLPEHILPFWAQESWTWHTVDWWRQLWSRTGLVKVLLADSLPDGWRLWLQWNKSRQEAGDGSPGLASDIWGLESTVDRTWDSTGCSLRCRRRESKAFGTSRRTARRRRQGPPMPSAGSGLTRGQESSP